MFTVPIKHRGDKEVTYHKVYEKKEMDAKGREGLNIQMTGAHIVFILGCLGVILCGILSILLKNLM